MNARITWGLVILLLVGVLGAAGAETTPVQGSFWYILDNITEVDAGAEIVIWVTLPPVWQGQEVKIGTIDPAPAAILDDPDTGNRVLEWHLQPKARRLGVAEDPWLELFHYDFELNQIEIRKHGPYVITEPYDKTTVAYQRYTRAETGIQTDGRILDLAREIAGPEKDPYQVGRRFYGWIMANMVFMPNSETGWDAMSILEAQRGNCDQFSTLFVALCRSVGLPARTVVNTWVWGGRHVFAELLLPGHGWVPADATVGQLQTNGRGGLSESEVEETLRARQVPLGDAGWTYGNLFGNRLIIALGKNISFDSPTMGTRVTLQSMQPGGVEAHPAGYRITGLNKDLVHGGFYVFGGGTTAEQARILAHQRLAKYFFKADVKDYEEDVCRQSGNKYAGALQTWINLGKVYLHKGKYYKAEAAFQRALRLGGAHKSDNQVLIVWLHNYLGNCYDLLDQREMAVAQYERALTYNDDYHGAVRYAQRYLVEPFVLK